MTAMNMGTNRTFDSNATAGPMGAPGFVTYAYVRYSLVPPVNANESPTVIINQPIGLRGFRDASTTPTVEYPRIMITAIGTK